ncbi:hypothetical protein MTE01_20100 [Microbacterium testaceum]|uniref:Uncharacterized protein n=1 Tax=Microbacterium testaceum TaxID=2033 RepID=A0A4Y3QLG7_MICTE|nr:hypothetical protein [Microbacterium testaceum]GEB46065.1 hypothetical protein MTE01_20100 [Microbacterium testaceum]
MANRPLLPVVLIVTGVLSLSACSAANTPAAETSAPAASPVSSAPSASPAAEPRSTPDAAPPVFTSCDEAITPEFRQMVADNGWVGWNMVGQQIGHSPFDVFPSGAPTGQLSCRFGAGPEVATDNVLDLAWAPIDEAAAQSAQKYLAEAGFQRIESTGATQWATRPGDGGWADDDGWGETYSFTGTDVRWAVTREDLAYIAPAA